MSDDVSFTESASGTTPTNAQDCLSRSFENGKPRRRRSQRHTKGAGQKSAFAKSLAIMRVHTQAARDAKNAHDAEQNDKMKSMAGAASNVVEFANMLLAKHEANMEQREK